MKVRCVLIVNPATRAIEKHSPWIRIGGEYVVLEISAAPNRQVSLRIHLEEGTPGLWDSTMFETTDVTIPSNWVAKVSLQGGLDLGPERWREPGFWERYFDREPDAVAAFDDEASVILRESNREDS
jgi:hypothetical protein